MIAPGATRLSQQQRAVIDHPLDRPAVVEAGAGTGKTFTIVERVAALVGSGAVRPDQILLLTFGRKAAAELRGRLLQRLGETPVPCQTFHSFAWSMLSEHLYDCGLSPETTVIEDAEARVEFKAAFDAYLSDEAVAESCGFPLHPFNRTELRSALFKIRQDLKQQGMSIEIFRDRALAAVDAFSHVSYRELRMARLKPYRGSNIKLIADVTPEAFDAQIAEERSRVMAAVAIFERFDRRLARRQLLTYADILVRAEQALSSNAALRNEMRSRYRCCVVDEYQDTDVAQRRLLEALFGAGLGCVMVVGDVLQSIYSFRGANPDNVRIFKDAPGAQSYPLSENRRSLQEILDLAHHCVLPAHADALALTGARGSAGEQIVHVSSLWEIGEDEGVVSPRDDGSLPFDQARVLEARAVARRISRMLHAGLTVQTSAGKSEAISPRHIAILSRTKANVGPVADALLEAGIPFRLVGGVGFYDAPEVRDALAWLRLLADPFDSAAVTRALQSSAIGACDAAVAVLAAREERDAPSFARAVLTGNLPDQTDDEGTAQAVAAAHKLRELLDDLSPYAALPLLGALRAVYERTGLERFHQDSVAPRAAQALANLEKLEALARGFAGDLPGAQPADFVAFIDELERVDFDEREADVPSANAVTISTIHSAKGLEWPVVFCLSVWTDPPHDARLFVHDDGSLLYAEGMDGGRPFHFQAVVRHADANGWVLREDERPVRDDAEERRLLYVAITRARDHLFVSGLRRKPSSQNQLGAPHPYLLRILKWFEERGLQLEDHRTLAASKPWQASPLRAQLLPVRRPASPLATKGVCPPLSYSLVADFERCPRRAVYRAEMHLPGVATPALRARARRGWEQRTGDGDSGMTPELAAPDDALLNDGDYGAVVHKALELWALDKHNGTVRKAGSLVEEAAGDLGLTVPPSQIAKATASVELVVQRLDGWTPLLTEAPFAMDLGSGGDSLLVYGFLDLLARDDRAKVCLVDYKSGGALGTKFELQLGLYRMAARDVYGLEVERCFIGRVAEDSFAFESIRPSSDDEVRAAIVQTREGFIRRDTTPKAGAWCGACAYRAAPCMDYQKRS